MLRARAKFRSGFKRCLDVWSVGSCRELGLGLGLGMGVEASVGRRWEGAVSEPVSLPSLLYGTYQHPHHTASVVPTPPSPHCSLLSLPPSLPPCRGLHLPGPSPIWTVLISLTNPLMLAEGPKAEIALGGRLPGTLTVVRNKSISLPCVLWM